MKLRYDSQPSLGALVYHSPRLIGWSEMMMCIRTCVLCFWGSSVHRDMQNDDMELLGFVERWVLAKHDIRDDPDATAGRAK